MLKKSSLFRQKGFSAHHCHFLSSVLSESLRPLHFSRVPFPVEVSVAFWSAKLERLRIIANKRYSVPRINWTRTEIAITYSHFLIDTRLRQGIRWRRRSAVVGVAVGSNCVFTFAVWIPRSLSYMKIQLNQLNWWNWWWEVCFSSPNHSYNRTYTRTYRLIPQHLHILTPLASRILISNIIAHLVSSLRI